LEEFLSEKYMPTAQNAYDNLFKNNNYTKWIAGIQLTDLSTKEVSKQTPMSVHYFKDIFVAPELGALIALKFAIITLNHATRKRHDYFNGIQGCRNETFREYANLHEHTIAEDPWVSAIKIKEPDKRKRPKFQDFDNFLPDFMSVGGFANTAGGRENCDGCMFSLIYFCSLSFRSDYFSEAVYHVATHSNFTALSLCEAKPLLLPYRSQSLMSSSKQPSSFKTFGSRGDMKPLELVQFDDLVSFTDMKVKGKYRSYNKMTDRLLNSTHAMRCIPILHSTTLVTGKLSYFCLNIYKCIQ
jgi:hypothetical protein